MFESMKRSVISKVKTGQSQTKHIEHATNLIRYKPFHSSSVVKLYTQNMDILTSCVTLFTYKFIKSPYGGNCIFDLTNLTLLMIQKKMLLFWANID